MTDLAKVAAELAPEASAMQTALTQIQSLAVTDDVSYALASDLVKAAKTRWAALDNRRKEITGPINAALKSVNDLFKPNLQSLAEAERILKGKIGRFVFEREAARIQAMAASAVQYAAGAIPTEIIPERPEAKGVAVKLVWDFRVTDPGLVPRELCSPDVAKIGQLSPGTTVPGIEWYQTPEVRVRK